MASVNSSGTQTATLATEHTLATITVVGFYQLLVDLGARAAGETVTIREYATVLSGGAERLVRSYVIGPGPGIDPIFQLPARTVGAGGIRYTLEQGGGTGRSYPWAVVAAG